MYLVAPVCLQPACWCNVAATIMAEVLQSSLSWERRQATASIDRVSLTSQTFIERIRDHLKVVLNIELCGAKQDILLRVHRENADALSKGNFLIMFKYDPRIQNCPEQLPRNWTLMSLNVQHELLESAGRSAVLLPFHCLIFAHDGISQEVMCISLIGLLLKGNIVYLKWVAHFSAQKLHFNQISLYVLDLIETKERVVLSHFKHCSAGWFHTLISVFCWFVKRTFGVFRELTKALKQRWR